MRIKHHKQIVAMLYDEWDLGKIKSHAKGKTCAWIYWFEILSQAEKIIIEKQNRNVIGVCGYTKWNSKKHLLRKTIYKIFNRCLIHSPLVPDKKAINEYNNNYNYLPKELNNYFDGELTILIINKSYRGIGIGKKLISNIFEIAKKDNLKKIQILTDESCNFKFYEKLGCYKIYEKRISNSEPNVCGNITSEIGFIYEKKLL